MSVHHSGNPVSGKSSVGSSFWKKSGVSSPFLPEKMNRHRISRHREKMNRHRISPLWREKGMSLILTV